MKNVFRSAITAIVLCSISSVVIAQDKQPTPEERAYKFRTSLFQTFAWKLGQMAQAKGKGEEAAFTQHAKDLAYLSSMIEEGFAIENSLPEGTTAKPEIWEDYSKFQEKISNFADLAKGFTEPETMSGFDPREFGSKACGSCHRDFRIKDE